MRNRLIVLVIFCLVNQAPVRKTENWTLGGNHLSSVFRQRQRQSPEYGYDNAGRMNRITEPGGSTTTMSYDAAGQRISQTDSNSGTTSYTYDILGNLRTTTDARGKTVTINYDELNRVTTVVRNEGMTTTNYDENGAIGKPAKVTENSDGTIITTEFTYDSYGRMKSSLKKIDDLQFSFNYDYDIMHRLSRLTYPDGTVINRKYSDSGHLKALTMDSSDGQSTNWPVVTYHSTCPSSPGAGCIVRTTGNDVKTEIFYNPQNQRPTGYKTTLPSGLTKQDVTYGYDASGNINSVTDRIYPDRSQSFQFDNQNRLTQAGFISISAIIGELNRAWNTLFWPR